MSSSQLKSRSLEEGLAAVGAGAGAASGAGAGGAGGKEHRGEAGAVGGRVAPQEAPRDAHLHRRRGKFLTGVFPVQKRSAILLQAGNPPKKTRITPKIPSGLALGILSSQACAELSETGIFRSNV